MPSIFLPNDVVASFLAALEAHGDAIPAPIARRRRRRRNKIMRRTPMQTVTGWKARGSAGDGDGDGDGDGGVGPPAEHNWTPGCVQHGDRGLVGQPADIGNMPCHTEETSGADRGRANGYGDGEGDAAENEQEQEQRSSNDGQQGPRKRQKKGRVEWRLDPEGGPVVTKAAGELLARILAIYGRTNRLALDSVLHGPTSPSQTKTAAGATDIKALVEKLSDQMTAMHIAELEYMLALMQLALSVDREQRDAKLKHEPNVSITKLAEQYGKPRSTFSDWVHFGHRLLLLCAAGTMYMLPIIAALDLRTEITRRCTTTDLLSLAAALRVDQFVDGQWLPMVRRLMIPIHYQQSSTGYIQMLSLQYRKLYVPGKAEDTQVISFGDLTLLDAIYDRVQTNYQILPSRSPEWHITNLPLWKPLDDPAMLKLPEARTIKTPLKLERLHALVEDLTQRLRAQHAGGTPNMYTEINSGILNGQPLFIRDANDKLVSLLLTLPEEHRQGISDAIDRKHFVTYPCTTPGTLDLGRRATQRLRMFTLMECAKTTTVAATLRGEPPHQSKEILKNPAQYAILAEAFTDLFEYLRVALKKYLPEDADQLSMYAGTLPLHASSPCYPFGGFVINLSSCTGGHRDKKDKKDCLILGAGKFTGGQLCLYEAGLSFDLQLGDVLVFPSLLFVVPIDLDDSEWGPLRVKLAPPICASRLTLRTAAAIAALHCGILGIPPAAMGSLILPSYEVENVVYGRRAGVLTDHELDLPLSEPSVVGKGFWIVPTGDIRFGWSDESRTQFLASVFKDLPKEKKQRTGQKKFREDIMALDHNRCVVSGDTKILDAAHIVDAYIGSAIFGRVISCIEDICGLYGALDPSVLQRADAQSPATLFADIRLPPAQFPVNGPVERINQSDNGELRTPSHHRNKDMYAGEAVCPHDGTMLWFDAESASNNIAIVSFGGLRGYLVPQGPAGFLYKNPNGIQKVEQWRFWPRTLALYNVFCRRFLPQANMQEITVAISRLAATVSQQNENEGSREDSDPGHLCERCGGGVGAQSTSGWGTGPFGGEREAGAGAGQTDEQDGAGGLPASTSSGSNSSQGTLVDRPPFRQVWWEVVEAELYKPLEVEDGEAGDLEKDKTKANLLTVLDVPRDHSVEELEDYHRSLVLQAICLLHLGAVLSATSSSTGSSPSPASSERTLTPPDDDGVQPRIADPLALPEFPYWQSWDWSKLKSRFLPPQSLVCISSVLSRYFPSQYVTHTHPSRS
ncbi:hypothetical protein DFH06DRAFT_1329760 [Mycena polygramma]|nr:hypothetical protein DFH06DRAFT_1329760 [Mycena polygramma]